VLDGCRTLFSLIVDSKNLYPHGALLSLRRKPSRRKEPVTLFLSTGCRYLNVPGASAVPSETAMTDRICGALGCTNDADGEAYIGDVKIHTCLPCADDKQFRVRLYE